MLPTNVNVRAPILPPGGENFDPIRLRKINLHGGESEKLVAYPIPTDI